MIPQRAIRYYASIPKLLIFLLVSGGFAVTGWLIWTRSHSIMGLVALIFFGFGALIFFYWLALTAIVRKPLLSFDEAGVHSTPALTPWRSTFIPWMSVQRLGIRAQKMSHFTAYYFVAHARVYKIANAPRRSLMTRLFPSLAHASIFVHLNPMYLFTTRQRRADMLERIRATFAQEITQYQVDMDMEERPL